MIESILFGRGVGFGRPENEIVMNERSYKFFFELTVFLLEFVDHVLLLFQLGLGFLVVGFAVGFDVFVAALEFEVFLIIL